MAISGDLELVLWFQFAYAMWQFVRVAKFCRLPYALLAHTFMWLIGRWGRPFAVRNYIVLQKGREKMYLSRAAHEGAKEGWLSSKGGRVCTFDPSVQTDVEEGAVTIRPLQCLTVKDDGLDYQLCSRSIDASFLWNYLRDNPDCFAKSADLIYPGFEILDRISHLDGLMKICHGDYIPVSRKRRFLAVPDRERELNQNFMRMLASVPLMVQAKGYQDQSVWISLAIVGIDQFSVLFNWLWQSLKEHLFYVFHVFMIKSGFQPRTREIVCTFFSTISNNMMYSDEVRMNFIRLRKGDKVYTMSPFNGTDFEILRNPEFERKRKPVRHYSENECGRYKQANGEEFESGTIPDGMPFFSHDVHGSRIDTMFFLHPGTDDGACYNFINKEHLHFGALRRNDKENFLDLLQVMEEMEMLPLVQTDADHFKSLKFNIFLNPGSSLRDITFLKVKKDGMIGG